MKALGEKMLLQAQYLFDESGSLDTAVRDHVHEGLAHIVYGAYDTIGMATCVDEFCEFIQVKTYEWFRERGFVEWFCVGASTLFNTTPRQFYRTKVTVGNKVTRFKKEKVA